MITDSYIVLYVMIDNIIYQVFISTNISFLFQGHEFIVPKMPKTVDAVIQTTEEAPDDGQAMEGDGYEEGSSGQNVIHAVFWVVKLPKNPLFSS